MQNYRNELKDRRKYLAHASVENPDFNPATAEDIATKAVLREYLANAAMEDAFLASLPKGEDVK